MLPTAAYSTLGDDAGTGAVQQCTSVQQRSEQCTAQCTKESPGALPSSPPFGVSGTSKGATTDRRATIEVSSSSFLPSYVTVAPNYKNPPGIDSFWFLLKVT